MVPSVGVAFVLEYLPQDNAHFVQRRLAVTSLDEVAELRKLYPSHDIGVSLGENPAGIYDYGTDAWFHFPDLEEDYQAGVDEWGNVSADDFDSIEVAEPTHEERERERIQALDDADAGL